MFSTRMTTSLCQGMPLFPDLASPTPEKNEQPTGVELFSVTQVNGQSGDRKILRETNNAMMLSIGESTTTNHVLFGGIIMEQAPNTIMSNDILSYISEKNYSFSVYGNKNMVVNGYCQLTASCDKSLTWIKNESCLRPYIVTGLHENIIISCPLSEDNTSILTDNGCLLVICDYPKAVFFDIAEHFFVLKKKAVIEPTSIIETEHIGENVSIGHFCHIAANVLIGDDVIIGDHVSITCPTVIGDKTILYAGVVIGSDGYGYYEGLDKKQHLVPHTGGVRIGCNVSIGANTCIDRGTIGDTIIEDGVKIDNLCHIAHNVVIGEDSMVIAQSLLGGSAVIKKNAYIAPCAAVMNQITIGEHALVGMGAVVTKDVEDNKVVAGVPAKALQDNI